jgi:hypothetical protein
VMLMCLMMVTNGGSMVRKLSRIAFIQGNLSFIYIYIYIYIFFTSYIYFFSYFNFPHPSIIWENWISYDYHI